MFDTHTHVHTHVHTCHSAALCPVSSLELHHHQASRAALTVVRGGGSLVSLPGHDGGSVVRLSSLHPPKDRTRVRVRRHVRRPDEGSRVCVLEKQRPPVN